MPRRGEQTPASSMDWSLRSLAEFLEALPEAALVIEHRERIVWGNALAADLFGVAAANLRDLPLASVFVSSYGGPSAPLDLDARTGRGAIASCLLVRPADGRRIPVEVSYRAIELDSRPAILAIVHDVTEQKRAEEELRSGDERLRQAVRVSGIGIFDHDHITDVHYWSPRQYELYGWPLDEPITVPAFLARLHPEDRDAIAAGIRKAHDPAGNGSFDVEHRILRSDGEIRWIATRSITLFAGEGGARRPIRTLGACRDLTEGKLGKERTERLTAVLDMTPDVVVITDIDGRSLYMNRAAHDLFGVRDGDSLTRARVNEHRPPWAVRRFLETAIPSTMRDGTWRGETAFLDGQGREVPFSQIILAHRDRAGKVAYLSTIARDISKEKKLEEQFLQAQKMEAVGRLAGGVAHDFNNLLSVILSAATLAHRELPVGHPAREVLEDVTSAGERAAELTRRMLAFSRKQVLRPQLVDVNDVIRGMLPMVRRLISERIEQVTVLDPELGFIEADPIQLEQVILNLVVNACDAMPSGGNIAIETTNTAVSAGPEANGGNKSPPPHVTIRVSDTGVGMDAATKARLFEPFFTTKPLGQGTGLGLSMVFGIVKQSGGEITVESEPGRGTTFHVSFPQAMDRRGSDAARSSSPPVRTEFAVILLVEDEVQLRKLVSRVLGKAGYRVLVAPGPREALAMAREFTGNIDLLLTDVVMPDMNGAELADALTIERPTTRVLYTTGYAENNLSQHGVLRSDIHLLPKPFTLDELLATVRKALDLEL
jgi:two-component system cell cycle sensor histidine kinase/response regulator CckA